MIIILYYIILYFIDSAITDLRLPNMRGNFTMHEHELGVVYTSSWAHLSKHLQLGTNVIGFTINRTSTAATKVYSYSM